jgi:hypothetical protein
MNGETSRSMYYINKLDLGLYFVSKVKYTLCVGSNFVCHDNHCLIGCFGSRCSFYPGGSKVPSAQ